MKSRALNFTNLDLFKKEHFLSVSKKTQPKKEEKKVYLFIFLV